MAVDQRARPTHEPRPQSRRGLSGSARRLLGGGTTGNERLTAATGVILIGLLAVIGVTILSLRSLLWVHLFVGMLLLGPVLLKLLSTGYRFTRYYTGNRAYRAKGAPPTVLRMIAPIVVLTTVIVFASGVALLLIGPSSRGTLLPIHKVSFIVWGVFTAVHVLAHMPSIPRLLSADYARTARLGGDVSGRAGRTLSLAGALVGGLVLAVLLIPDFAPWVHASATFHRH
jgi:hypothetical protein